ncbi:hypothetical protein [Maribacter polysaccharolyticus]|uniref:hypothetical protein n=1 Tax=Maribacter polysaccharolyticus TaxID=3020831 RepID=UPI00237FB142|nr:hypothetical protein [Maribacter polysaccharolyticus]MDE3743307.1 hypothetical protein [Maribacter polysaccharolyticus]
MAKWSKAGHAIIYQMRSIYWNMASESTYSFMEDGDYLPTDFIWSYGANTPNDFNSASISGVGRLPNGNT